MMASLNTSTPKKIDLEVLTQKIKLQLEKKKKAPTKRCGCS